MHRRHALLFVLLAETFLRAATLGPGDNLALGRAYTWSRPPNYALTADDADRTQLTDGTLTSQQWFEKGMVCWQGTEPLTLTLDLGAVQPIAAVRVRLAARRGSGVHYPERLAAFVSDDGRRWWEADRLAFQSYRGDLRDDPYKTLELDGLRTAGRYVAVVMRPQSQYLMVDEIEVVRGGHAPGDVIRDPALALAAPRVVDVYFREEVYVVPGLTVPVNFGRTVRNSGAPGIDVWLPEGVEVAAADAEPAARAFASGTADGHRTSYPSTVSTLYLRTDWPAGRSGVLTLALPDGAQRVRLTAIDIPQAPRPQRLMCDVDWIEVGYKLRWPGFFEFWDRVGLNTVSLAKQDTPRPVPDPAMDAFVAEARRRGMHVAANYSPLYEGLQRASRARPRTQRVVSLAGQVSPSCMCPRVYLEDGFESEIADILRGVGHGVSWFWFDFEPEWAVIGPACFCPHCKAEFAAFLKAEGGPAYVDPQQVERAPQEHLALHQAWMRFQSAFGQEVFRRIREAVTAEVAARQVSSAPRFMVGLYNVSPLWETERTRFYHHFLHYGDLAEAGLVEMAMPSLYHRLREEAGDGVRASKQGLAPEALLLPWLGIDIGGDEWKYVLLETFANGGEGFTYFTARQVDGRDYRTIAEVLRAVVPVEDLVMDGAPLTEQDASVTGHGRVVGLKRDGERLLLVTNYWDLAKGPVTVKLAGAGGTVTDLETSEAVATVPAGGGSFEVTLAAERKARLLVVR